MTETIFKISADQIVIFFFLPRVDDGSSVASSPSASLDGRRRWAARSITEKRPADEDAAVADIIIDLGKRRGKRSASKQPSASSLDDDDISNRLQSLGISVSQSSRRNSAAMTDVL